MASVRACQPLPRHRRCATGDPTAPRATSPFGTCGGFQHAVLEYARNVLGWADAEHGQNWRRRPGAQ